jgi:hypothetical protein
MDQVRPALRLHQTGGNVAMDGARRSLGRARELGNRESKREEYSVHAMSRRTGLGADSLDDEKPDEMGACRADKIGPKN